VQRSKPLPSGPSETTLIRERSKVTGMATDNSERRGNGKGAGRTWRREKVARSQERLVAWQSLPLDEQLRRLPEGGANKQRARIQAKLAAAVAAQKQPAKRK
jgi:hypothetical protein